MTAPQPPRDLLIRVLIPAAVALIFIAVLVSERGSATRDLQLLAPVRAAPGQPLPLRAYLFDLREEIPRALAEPVALRLEDEGGTVLAETRLEPVGEPRRGRTARRPGHAVADAHRERQRASSAAVVDVCGQLPHGAVGPERAGWLASASGVDEGAPTGAGHQREEHGQPKNAHH